MPNLETPTEEEYVTKLSPYGVAETVSRFTGLVEAKGMKIFVTIDQRAEARQVNLDLRDTVLVLFGSPASGTPVMSASPLAALDLPLKVLVWADGPRTKVSYLAPSALVARHSLSLELAAPLAGIDTLTDMLVTSGTQPTE